MRIAFLHLAPLPGDVAGNRELIETAVTTAAEAGATWVLTPELAVCGYSFAGRIGTEWIGLQPDPWMTRLCRLAARLRVTVFLSHPERDPLTNELHNSLFVIAPDGALTGVHRKINALRAGSEAWSTPGTRAAPVSAPPIELVGLLICADAHSPKIVESLKSGGARMLVSSAAWAPGFHGPNGEWERCSKDTGLPLLVCNRTGPDVTLDFTEAESVVVKDGQRRLSMSSDRSAVFLIEWNQATEDLASPGYERIGL